MTVRISRYVSIVATAAAAGLAACASSTSRGGVTMAGSAVATTTNVKPFFV